MIVPYGVTKKSRGKKNHCRYRKR